MPYSHTPVYVPIDASSKSMGSNNIFADSCSTSTTTEVDILPAIDPVGPFGIAENTLSHNNLTWVSGSSANKWNYSSIPISNTDKVYMEFVQGGDVGGSHTPGFAIVDADHPGGDKYPGQTNNDWGFYLGIGTTTNAGQVGHDRGTLGNAGRILNAQVGGADGDVYMMARHGANLWFGANGTWYDSATSTEIANGTTTNSQFNSGQHPLPTDVRLYVGFHCYGSSAKLTWRPSSSQWSFTPPTGFGEMKSTITGLANYATFNSIAGSDRKGGLSNGNLRASGVSKDNFSTMNIPLTGKWYFEGTLTAVAGTGKDAIGVVEAKSDQIGAYADTVTVLYAKSGEKFLGSSWESYNATYAAGDIIGVYVADGQVTFYKNNTSQGTCGSAFTTQCFATTQNANSATVWDLNFGQKSFTYTPPTDALALNTANLTTPTVTKPSNHFKAIIYEGTGAELSTGDTGVEALDFQPDWVWIKNRDATDSHMLYDSVRGATKDLHTDTSDTESTTAQTLKSFDANGFTLGTDVQVNTLNESYVAFCLEAGTSWSESSFGSNGLASSGKKSSTHNFSIVSWTHRTSANYAIKHNLGTTPEFFITKSRGQGLNWSSWHKDFADTAKRFWINESVAESTSYWADASDSADGTGAYADISSGESPVTSTLFALQDGEATGAHAAIAYFFARTPGLIGIGHYIGNNSTDGPYVVADDGASGFKPAWVMIKRVDSTGEWNISDNVRDPDNPVRLIVQANANAVEWNATTRDVDWLANGFKIRSAHVDFNADNGRYIYLAFAEAPFGGSGIVQARAR